MVADDHLADNILQFQVLELDPFRVGPQAQVEEFGDDHQLRGGVGPQGVLCPDLHVLVFKRRDTVRIETGRSLLVRLREAGTSVHRQQELVAVDQIRLDGQLSFQRSAPECRGTELAQLAIKTQVALAQVQAGIFQGDAVGVVFNVSPFQIHGDREIAAEEAQLVEIDLATGFPSAQQARGGAGVGYGGRVALATCAGLTDCGTAAVAGRLFQPLLDGVAIGERLERELAIGKDSAGASGYHEIFQCIHAQAEPGFRDSLVVGRSLDTAIERRIL